MTVTIYPNRVLNRIGDGGSYGEQKPIALLPTPTTWPLVCEGRELVDLDNGRSAMMFSSIRFPNDVVVGTNYKNGFVDFYLEEANHSQRRGSCQSCPGKLQTEQENPGMLVEQNGSANLTTYMIRNIPTRFTSITFVRLLDEYGFRDTFDFFYLPMDFRSGKNMGYAFINFRLASVGLRFAHKLHLRRLPVSTSKKVIEVAPSRRQGLLDNVALFRTSDLLNSISLPHYKPLISTPQTGGMLVPLNDDNFPPYLCHH